MSDRPDHSRAPWRPELFEGVPGFPQASHWQVRPEPPLEIVYAGLYQDGGAGFMVVRDAAGRRWPFCVDLEVGRLCTGSHPAGEQAAFVRPGSPLEADVLALMARTVQRVAHEGVHGRQAPELKTLPSLYERALAHSGAHGRRPGWHSIQT